MPKPKKPKKGAPAWMVKNRHNIPYPSYQRGYVITHVANGEA